MKIRGHGNPSGVRKPRTFRITQDGKGTELLDSAMYEYITKDVCSWLGLESSLKLEEYFPMDLLQLMPSDNVTFEEHWGS